MVPAAMLATTMPVLSAMTVMSRDAVPDEGVTRSDRLRVCGRDRCEAERAEERGAGNERGADPATCGEDEEMRVHDVFLGAV